MRCPLLLHFKSRSVGTWNGPIRRMYQINRETESYQNALEMQLMDEIESCEHGMNSVEGSVVEQKGFVCSISGLEQAHIGSIVSLETAQEEKKGTGTYGIVLNLQKKLAAVGILNRTAGHQPSFVKAKLCETENRRDPTLAQRALDIFRGKVIDPVGNILRVPLEKEHTLLVLEEEEGNDMLPPILQLLMDRKGKMLGLNLPKIIERKPVSRPLHTGIRLIDCFQPIGHGHRLAIIGQSENQKSVLAIDMLSRMTQQQSLQDENAKSIHFVYVAIGKSQRRLDEITQLLERSGAMKSTTIVGTTDEDSITMQYLTPFSALNLAQLYSEQNHHDQDIVMVFDDLSHHSSVTGELIDMLSLSSNASSSTKRHKLKTRESTQHAYSQMFLPNHVALLESMGQFKHGGAITALALASSGQVVDPSESILKGFNAALISAADDWFYLEDDKTNYPSIRSISSNELVSNANAIISWMKEDCLGGKSIRGAPFQCPTQWKLVHQIQKCLIESVQAYQRVDLARQFGIDAEPEDLNMVDWKEAVHDFWRQKPFDHLNDVCDDGANSKECRTKNQQEVMILGLYMLLHAQDTLLVLLNPISKEEKKSKFDFFTPALSQVSVWETIEQYREHLLQSNATLYQTFVTSVKDDTSYHHQDIVLEFKKYCESV